MKSMMNLCLSANLQQSQTRYGSITECHYVLALPNLCALIASLSVSVLILCFAAVTIALHSLHCCRLPASPTAMACLVEHRLYVETHALQAAVTPASEPCEAPPAPSQRQVQLLNGLRNRVFMHEGVPW